MKDTQKIKDFYGRIIGTIETDTVTGDKVGKDFYGRIVGFYDKKTDSTKDFYRRVVSRGDTLSGLILQAEEENRKK